MNTTAKSNNQKLVVKSAPDDIAVSYGAKTFVQFPGGSVNVKPGKGVNVEFPGGSVNVEIGKGTLVEFPGGSVGVNVGEGTSVNFPGGSVGVNVGEGTSVNFPGGNVGVNVGEGTSVNFPGGSVDVTPTGGTKVLFPEGQVVVTGSSGADTFVFSGETKSSSLKSSTLKSRDRIKNLDFSAGDKIQLDFDDDLNTEERPTKLFNTGRQKEATLQLAVKAAYEDKLPLKKGEQALKANEAVLFKYKQQTFLSINDSKGAFSPKNDLVIDVTGAKLKVGDAAIGVLTVTDYFV